MARPTKEIPLLKRYEGELSIHLSQQGILRVLAGLGIKKSTHCNHEYFVVMSVAQ